MSQLPDAAIDIVFNTAVQRPRRGQIGSPGTCDDESIVLRYCSGYVG